MEYLKFFANTPNKKKRCRGNRKGKGSYTLHGDNGTACEAFHKTGAADRRGLAYRSVQQEYTGYFGWDSVTDRVSWAMVAVNSTLSVQSSASFGRPVYREIQGLLDSEGHGAVQAAKLWPQMVTEEAMVTAAWTGALLSLGVACVTLLAFTLSFALTALCAAAIASIVVITMGMMPILGWEFGFLEAMCMVFVVGFSVDFVAHCAVAYQESAHKSRRAKATVAVATVGISVFWGMLTTCAAAFFLLFCVMVPFSKMGIFLIWNQLVSFTFAVFPFLAALMVLGPRGSGKLCSRVPALASTARAA